MKPLFGAMKLLLLPLSLAAGYALGAALLPAGQEQAKPPSRVRIVAQTSDERLEDIQQSPDGKLLLTHDRGFAPRLWDAETMRLLRVLGGLADSVHFVSFSPDGRLILCLAETQAAIWDSNKGEMIGAFAPPEGKRFRAAAFAPTSKTVAISTLQGPIYLLGTDLKETASELLGHTNDVRAIEFSPDGKYLIAGDMNRMAKIWDIATKTVKWNLGDQGHGVPWAHFSKDSKYALVSSFDFTAHLYDVATGKQLWKKRHTIADKGMAINTHMAAVFVGKDKPLALLAADDGTMSLYDPATGALVKELKGHTMALREIRASQDGTKVATYGDDDELKIWDVEAGKELPFPHRTYQETAGEFSPDGTTWWLGHKDGHITAHDVLTGEVRSETLGAVQAMSGAFLAAPDRGLWTQLQTYQVLWNTHGLNERVSVVGSGTAPELSPNAERMLTYSPRDVQGELNPFPLVLRDVATRKYVMAFKECEGTRFSPDSSLFVTWKKTGDAHVWKSSDGSFVKGWKWDEKYRFESCAIAPDGKTVASVGGANGDFLFFWDIETGKTTDSYLLRTGHPRDVAYSPDGKLVAVAGDSGLQIFTVEDMKTKLEAKAEFFSDARLVFNKDGSKLASLSGFKLAVWDVGSGIQLIDERVSYSAPVLPQGLFSPDGKKILRFFENYVVVWNLEAARREAMLLLSDNVNGASFTPDGKRILTVDNTDGMTIWDAAEPQPRRLGQMMVMNNGEWLVYDMEGRFDADDPDHIEAAHFVLTWEGGMEPIALKQLKAQFFEPGLLAKLLGQDKDPPREVPSLDSLRLFPTIEVVKSKSNPMVLEATLEDRDEGGIGKISILVNGKQVMTRRGTGFFKVDLNEYMQYLLPETFLPKGKGNEVSILASNEEGTLWSRPVSLDVGVPEGLKAPPVTLYALCAGVGDYVGDGSDLQAPPSDAKALSKAIQETGERLLPGRVKVTTLTTDASDASQKPTRERILKWLEETAKSASSTDIVLVFFSGHGVNVLGEQRGYFFLTADGNPSEVNATSIGTATISGEVLKDELAKIPANKQVVILDTCHSGAAAGSLLGGQSLAGKTRSLSGDYRRAWDSIRDSTGVWMLAGSAADQLSYESANVEHGMLTYALLEAIDRASGEGLRKAPSGELFVDVESWLSYAASRVESLKNEVGLDGIQKPQFSRSTGGTSFDIGVTNPDKRGSIGLKPPKPIVILGNFSMDEEDPAKLEGPMRAAFKDSLQLKAWFEVSKHPGVYRVAGTYVLEGDAVKVKVFLQEFDAQQQRKTLETFDLAGRKDQLADLALSIRKEVEQRIDKLEEAKKDAKGGG